MSNEKCFVKVLTNQVIDGLGVMGPYTGVISEPVLGNIIQNHYKVYALDADKKNVFEITRKEYLANEKSVSKLVGKKGYVVDKNGRVVKLTPTKQPTPPATVAPPEKILESDEPAKQEENVEIDNKPETPADITDVKKTVHPNVQDRNGKRKK